MKNYYLVRDKNENAWKLKKEHAQRSTAVFDNKEAAMDFSTEFMRQNNGSLHVQKRNGEWQEERTYPKSSDPKKTKG